MPPDVVIPHHFSCPVCGQEVNWRVRVRAPRLRDSENESYIVQLQVNNRFFPVGGPDWEDKEHADWYASQLQQAMHAAACGGKA